MKKLLKPFALFLVLTLLSQLFVINSMAAVSTGTCGSGVTYSFDSDTGIFTLSGSGATDTYVKFDEEGWSPVWRPGSSGSSNNTKCVPWQKNTESIKTVIIEDGITKIGDNVFSQCYNIETIVFRAQTAQISSSAFDLTNKNYTVYLYQNSTADSFFSSDEYTKVYLDAAEEDASKFDYSVNPDGTTITITCYNGKETNVVIPAEIDGYRVNVIGGYAFGWLGITSVTIPESVTAIESKAFTDCTSLQSIVFKSTNTSIDASAFYSCSNLKTVFLYENSTADEYFSADYYTKIYFEEAIVSETYTVSYYANGGENAPEAQTKTEDVELTLSLDVPTREGFNFMGWATSTDGEVAYAPGDYYTENADLTLYAVWKEISDEPIIPNDFEYEVNLDETTVTITKYLGEGGDVVIPSTIDGYSVTGIGFQAFLDCETLTSVTLSDSITIIEEMAFGYCSNLTSISFGNNLNIIGDRIFESCISLKSAVIPASVSSIGQEPFFNCYSITEITVDENNEYFCDLDGVLFTKDMETLIHYPVGSDDTEYVIPSEVKHIGRCAFYKAFNLSSITIPDSVESIGFFAFFDCINLESVEIPSNLEIIDRSAFAYCTALTSVIIPSSVTSIGSRAFANCHSLADVTVPKTVTSIESDSFVDCSALNTIYLYRDSTADEYFSTDEYTKVYLDSEIEAVCGDVNGDGEIDIKDIVLLAQFLANWNVEIDENTADCNADGAVNIKDVVLLAQYLANWKVSLG